MENQKATEALIELALRRQAEDDLYTFVQLAWPHIEGRKLQTGWLIKCLCDHLEEVYYGRIRRLNINMPPRMAKSSLVSIIFPVWVWIKSPQMQFLCSSYSEKLSIRDNIRARRLFKTKWFQTRWGDRITLSDDQDTKMRVDNMQNGYRIATGMGGTVRGEGGDCLVAGTMIFTQEGAIPIEVIAKNPKRYQVYSYDFSLGKVVKCDIIASLTRNKKAEYEVFTNEGNSIRCTGNHRIYIQGRGFTPASELRLGEVILCAGRKENFSRPYLRLLWKKRKKEYIRHQESYRAEKQRIFLWKQLQEKVSFRKKSEAMSYLQKKNALSLFSMLLGEVQGVCAIIKKKTSNNKKVPRVRERIHAKKFPASILLKKLFQFCTLKKHEGFSKYPIQSKHGSHTLQSIFFQNETIDYGARWILLRNMFKKRKEKNYYWESKDISACSSYRWKTIRSFARKFNNFMRFMSYAPPCGKFSRITSIKRNSDKEQQVYDIQVKGTHNFFANGILVHNCIILDDINDVSDRSEVQLENAIEFYTQVLPTRFNDFKTGRLINVQQRLHMRDVSGYIIANQSKEFVNLILPMEYEGHRKCVTVPLKSTNGKPWEDPRTEEGELLMPERIGPEELKSLKLSLGGEYAVAGQLQQRPAPSEGGMIKRNWWMPWKEEASPKISFIIQAWDTGSSEKKTAAYSACSTWGIFLNEHSHPCIILLGVWRKKVEVPELYKQVARMARDYRATTPDRLINEAYKPDIVLIEEKASGIPVLQSLKRTGIQIVGWRPDKFGDKIERVRKVTPLIESGRVYVPYKAPDFTKMKSYADLLVEQAAVFPRGDSRDLLDTVSMVLQRCIVSGWVLHPMEQAASQEDEHRREYFGVEEKGFY